MKDEHRREAEAASLQLTRDVRNELVQTLKSLGGKQSRGAYDKFLFFSANQMNKCAEAYLMLREANRVDASKFLIRPLIEMMFRTRLVAVKPAFFYRMILTERIKRKEWIKGAAKRQGKPYDAAEEARQWDIFRQHCITTFPDTDLLEEGLSVRAVAKAIDLRWYYDSFYAMYCTFTHGAFEAVMGKLDAISDAYDNRTVALTIFSAVEGLVPLGGQAPNFDSLRQRLREIDNE